MDLPEVSKDQLAALWDSGAPLDQAWVKFARFFDSFAHRALRTVPSNDPDVLAGDPRYIELRSWLPKTWEARKEKLAVTTTNERYHLLGEIYAGRLWAIGFRTLPDGSDELVRVPRRHFLFEEGAGPEIAIRWPEGELRTGDTTYFDIRIVRPPVVGRAPEPRPEPAAAREPESEAMAETLPATPTVEATWPASAAQKGGRRSTDAEIRDKVRELWGEPIFHTMKNRLDQAREVRARLKGAHTRHADDMQGYTSSFIKRIIGEVANELGQANQTE